MTLKLGQCPWKGMHWQLQTKYVALIWTAVMLCKNGCSGWNGWQEAWLGWGPQPPGSLHAGTVLKKRTCTLQLNVHCTRFITEPSLAWHNYGYSDWGGLNVMVRMVRVLYCSQSIALTRTTSMCEIKMSGSKEVSAISESTLQSCYVPAYPFSFQSCSSLKELTQQH